MRCGVASAYLLGKLPGCLSLKDVIAGPHGAQVPSLGCERGCDELQQPFADTAVNCWLIWVPQTAAEPCLCLLQQELLGSRLRERFREEQERGELGLSDVWLCTAGCSYTCRAMSGFSRHAVIC